MSANADTPTLVCHGIIGTHLPGVTRRLHRIAAPCAYRVNTIASPHIHRVSSMSDVVGTGVTAQLRKPWILTRRSGETQPSCRQRFRHSFKSHGRQTKCQAKQTRYGTSKRMTSQPDICIRVDLRHVGVEINGGSIVSILIVHCLSDAGQVC